MDALGKRLALARAEEIVAAVIGGEPTERSDAALDAICREAAARLIGSTDYTDYT